MGAAGYVAAVSALTAAITSWSEFTDVGRKLERYSSAIHSIKKHVDCWDSLGQVEKSSVPKITQLVLGGEALIMGELSGWRSTITANDKGDKADEAGPAAMAKAPGKVAQLQQKQQQQQI